MSEQTPTVEAEPRSSFLAPLGWAIFLACSWTWCIGMFLPVLLVRDYGVWGWIVFAIPNVIGAAAMGWVLRSAEQSRALVEAHRPALVAFSFVTATFQIFFAFWMFARTGAPETVAIVAMTALLTLLLTLAPRSATAMLLSVIIFLASLLCILKSAQTQELALRQWFANMSRPSAGALYLAPVCAFGFLLCPYLDLTFHRARQSLSPAQSRIAFTLGFCVFFLAMIVFTLAYAGALMKLPDATPGRTFLWWIRLHMALQLGFTIGVHWSHATPPLTSTRKDIPAYALVNGTLLAGFAAWWLTRRVHFTNLEPGELVYRFFMAFYGLVFPAYVWLCMITFRARAASRRALVITLIAILLASPFYYLSFIQGRMLYLLPGLTVVLLARLAISVRQGKLPGKDAS